MAARNGAGVSRRLGAVAACLLALGLVMWLCWPSADLPPLAVASRVTADPAHESIPLANITSTLLSPAAARAELVLPSLTKTTDIEWRNLLISRNDLVAEVVAVPHYTRVAKLLRNATFNPRDDYILPAMRERVTAVVTAGVATAGVLADEQHAACAREWQILHAQGATVIFELGSRSSLQQLQRIGADPLFRVENDITYGVSRERMPATQRAALRVREAGASLCDELAAAFADAGTLTPDESTAIVARARASTGHQSGSR